MSRIANNVDSVVENIEKEIDQNANVCNITKSIGIDRSRILKFTHLCVYSLCYLNCLSKTGQPNQTQTNFEKYTRK